MPHPELSVIIPAFNEEKTIASTCKRLNDFLSAHYASFEILFVNDGSMDQTAEMIGSLAKEYPAVRPEGYEKNRGKGCAVRTGMLAASGEVRVFTDCDLAYGESAIKDLVDAMKKSGADIVIGSRAIASDGYSGYSFLRKAMSRVYLCLIRLLT